MENNRMQPPYRNSGSFPSASQHPPVMSSSQIWSPNMNQKFPHTFRTDKNQATNQQSLHVGSSTLNNIGIHPQQSSQYHPNGPSIPQFPPPAPDSVCSTNQHHPVFSSQGSRTIGSQHCMNTNATSDNSQYFQQSNSPTWFPSPTTTFNHSVPSNSLLPSCTPNAQSQISLNGRNIPSNFSVSTPPPTFSARFNTPSIPLDFNSHVKVENTNVPRFMPPSFATNAHQLQHVVNVHQQQTNPQNVVTGVHQVQTVPQSSFHVPHNLPFTVPPFQNADVYQLMRPPYHMPEVTDGLHFPTSVVKQELMQGEEKNANDELVKDFLAKAKLKDVSSKNDGPTCITIPEFQSLMRTALSLLVKLAAEKNSLCELMSSGEEVWNEKLNYINQLKGQFSEVDRKLSNNNILSGILIKLKKTARKRKKNLARKERYMCYKKKKQQDRLQLHQNMNLWLETLREKDLQKKREAEMKKEADSILSEVRRKIQEAKRAIEKLKIFQKLRQARKEHAQKKGMFVHSKSDVFFNKKILEMKDVMLKQLLDYEAEEKALKVMLETEKEGQMEAEAQWKLKQLRKHQEKKCSNILNSFFGQSEPPLLNHPQYFFWQHYNAGNCDINSLLKIRHDWDMYLVPRDSKGSSIPQRWVVPETPSSDAWSFALEANLKKI